MYLHLIGCNRVCMCNAILRTRTPLVLWALHFYSFMISELQTPAILTSSSGVFTSCILSTLIYVLIAFFFLSHSTRFVSIWTHIFPLYMYIYIYIFAFIFSPSSTCYLNIRKKKKYIKYLFMWTSMFSCKMHTNLARASF